MTPEWTVKERIEPDEFERFQAFDGVGPVTAEKLVDTYGTVERAAELLLGCPAGYNRNVGQRKCNELRDELQSVGFTPPCGCEHYDDVRYSQTREDVLSHCRTCGETIQKSVD